LRHLFHERPTIGFSDASGTPLPTRQRATIVEEHVCVQPFVMCKSTATVGGVTNISNVTWEQLEYGIPQGRIPLAAWTSKITDTNTFVYLLQRTKDSGTRRTFTAGRVLSIQRPGWSPAFVYIYDYTNNFFYIPTANAATTYGASPNGVVGSAGFNNVN
jgi:hypothetical protein